MLKLRNLLLRPASLTIYKIYLSPHLNYGNIIFDEAYNGSFHQKLKSVQYNACLAKTGEIEVALKKSSTKN